MGNRIGSDEHLAGKVRHTPRLIAIIAAICVAQSAPAQPPVSTAPPAKASENDSLRAQRLAWAPLHFLYRREYTSPYLMELARERVRAAYNKYQPIIPGDDWLAGLRISFPVPGGRMSAVHRGLPDCRATTWWCEMMYTLLLWRSRRFDEAASMLENGLAHMTPQARCIWADVSMLITDPRQRTVYEGMTCDERAAVEEKLWWLADPLHSVPGNERRIDHYARAVGLRLRTERDIPHVEGYPWALAATRSATHKFTGTDLKLSQLNPSRAGAAGAHPRGPDGILLRAFKSVRHADYRRANFMGLEDGMKNGTVGGPAGDVPAPPHQFVPDYAAVQSPFNSLATDWNLRATRSAESGRSPVGPIVPIDAQHAFFHRGDSARLVVVSEPSANPFLAGTLTRAALAFSRSPREVPVVHRIGGQTRYEFSPVVPADSMVLSLEVIAVSRGAGRVRFGAAPPAATGGRLRLSDILLLAPDDANNASALNLDSVISRALPRTELAGNTKAGLFWEVYGLRPGEQPEISIALMRAGPARPAGRATTGGTPPRQQSARSVTWTESSVQGREIEPGRFTLDLAGVASGTYELVLRVAVPGETAATVARRVVIR